MRRKLSLLVLAVLLTMGSTACGKEEPKQEYTVGINYINMIDQAQSTGMSEWTVTTEKLLDTLHEQLEVEYEIVDDQVVYQSVRGFDLTGYHVQVTKTEDDRRFEITNAQMPTYTLNPYKPNRITFAVTAE